MMKGKKDDRFCEDQIPAKKMCSSRDNQDLSESFTPREYQIEILEAAKERNTIACLGTGTGKTFIAVLLIREMTAKAKIPFDQGGKKIFFLVPTVPLVHQQAKVIENHTELKVGEYFGEMNIDAWSIEDWTAQFLEKEVLVMTAEICRIILHHSFLHLSRICLLIFDECHQARGNSPYSEIMKHISSSDCEEKPKIFGLSASLLNGKVKPAKVEKYLRELESILMSRIVTVSDYDEVMKYGTDPDEILVLYNSKSENPIDPECSRALDMLQETALRLKEFAAPSLSEEGEVRFFTKPQRCITQLCNLFHELGPWCAQCAAKLFCNEINKCLRPLNEREEIDKLMHVKEVLSLCSDIFGKASRAGNSQSLKKLPSKLRRFLEIFEAMRDWDLSQTPAAESLPDPENSQAKMKSPVCIVFVQQRIFAYVLCEWIREICSTVDGFGFMKADFIVGHGTVGSSVEAKEAQMSVKQQQQIVKRFRDREFNILIATSVLEEGMDIQKCNVVVRFDMPKDFRSYVQSKGRARAAGSKYVILLPMEERCGFIEDLCTFKTVEDLLKKCHDRKEPDEEMLLMYLKEDPIPPYQPLTAEGSPRVTLSSSISLINRYCAKLPSDMVSRLTAHWKVNVLDPDSPEKFYVCTLRMPINSPLRKPIVGKPMKRKKLAKMAAALEACKLLHQLGELNDHLLPFNLSVDVEAKELGALEEEGVTEDGLQPGTNKRKQLYKKGVANVLKNNIPCKNLSCYLHVIVMDLVVPLAKSLNPRKRPIINPSDSPRMFGLLTTQILPKVPRFPIFTKMGKIQVSVHCIEKPFMLNALQVKDLESFHRFLFSETLGLEKDGMGFYPALSDFSTLVVPAKRESSVDYSLDWEFVKYTLEHDYNVEKMKSTHNVTRPDFNQNLFANSVVTRIYLMDQWKTRKPSFYYVNKIRYDMTPMDTFDSNKFLSFKAFYEGRHNIVIKSDHQPILEVELCSSVDLIRPMYTTVAQVHDLDRLSNTQQRHANFKEFLVPELCLIHPFPSMLFRVASYLPSALYRLNSLLVAEQIRYSVAQKEHVGKVSLKPDFNWPVFNFEKSDSKLREKLVDAGEIIQEEYPPLTEHADISKSENGEISSFEVKLDLSESLGPNPSCILVALTTTSARDEFNLERLETIGDSFLKYAASVKIYTSYPHLDEGNLTLLRSRLICNRNLYQLAKQKNLPQYLVHQPFYTRLSWLPPCYGIQENVYVRNERKEKKLVTHVLKKLENSKADEVAGQLSSLQLVSDKCIADMMEALIGAYLLSCGSEGALHFMSWLGISPFPHTEGEREVKSWPPVPRSPLIVDSADIEGCLTKMELLQGFDQFQKRINYHFKEPAYLLQAFTHASYFYNEITDCYQRLEFLGDAVLDFLITRKLYDDPKEHDPGKLTDLRSALVNNIYFASLAVKYGYHKNLKCLSVTLCKLVDKYITMLSESDAYKVFEEFGYYLEEIECFNLEEVEVPKALGDVFESVAGAIYLDSGMSLDAVWNVYYPMMKPAIDHLTESVPKSPVRELYEMVKNEDLFTVIQCDDEKSRIRVTLPDGQEFVGIGPNKRVAKRSAAKRAVHYLKFQKNAP